MHLRCCRFAFGNGVIDLALAQIGSKVVLCRLLGENGCLDFALDLASTRCLLGQFRANLIEVAFIPFRPQGSEIKLVAHVRRGAFRQSDLVAQSHACFTP